MDWTNFGHVGRAAKDELEDFGQRQVDYGYNIKVSFLESL